MVFEISRKTAPPKKSKSPNFASNQHQGRNKFTSTPFSVLITCANEAAVRDKCNYTTNKTCMSLAKQKVSFVFRWTKGLQRKTEFFGIHYVSKTKCKSTKTILEECFPCENKRSCKKMKIGPKSDTCICPFCMKALHSNNSQKNRIM